MLPLRASSGQTSATVSPMMCVPVNSSGFSGGNRIERSCTRLFGSRVSFRKEPTNTETYEIHLASNGDHWGLASLDAFYSYGPNKAVDRYTRHITLVSAGKIRFVTPEIPDESRFFRSGTVSWPGLETVREALMKTDAPHTRNPVTAAYGTACPMLPALEVKTDVAPFHVTAIDRQIPFETGLLYVCTPECTIPYSWDGTQYSAREPDCLEDGNWGVRPGKTTAQP